MIVSKAVDDLITAFRRLPGVGPRSAQRIVFQLLVHDRDGAFEIAKTLQFAAEKVLHCEQCNNFSETPICKICSSPNRDHSKLCVLETPADLSAFEATGIFDGTYYLLMGRISPINGIGPNELGVEKLLRTLANNSVKEVILGMNSTIEGEATIEYLCEVLDQNGVSPTILARGLPVGSEMEYLDSRTLAEAFKRRIPAHS